jgi:hypothetical protein
MADGEAGCEAGITAIGSKEILGQIVGADGARDEAMGRFLLAVGKTKLKDGKT